MYEKFKGKESKFLSKDDLQEFKHLQQLMDPTNFPNLSQKIEDEKDKFRDWYSKATSEINPMNATTYISQITKEKANNDDINAWFRWRVGHFESYIVEGINQVFNDKAILADFDNYVKSFNNISTHLGNLIKEVEESKPFNSYPEVNLVYKGFMNQSKAWFTTIENEIKLLQNLLFPSGYLYIQVHDQLEPEHIFNPNQLLMFADNPGSELYLQNFKTINAQNASLRIYLWKKT